MQKLTGNVLAVLESLCLVSSKVNQPAWLDGRNGPKLVVVRNGLLDLEAAARGETGCLSPHDPEYFSGVALPYNYDPDAPTPTRWLKFLDEVLPGDPDAIKALQEWAGYLLSGSTTQQKILLMVGPPRAGKGTIQRVITGLMGAANVGSLTGETLAGKWGLASIAHKSVAAIPDARFDHKTGSSTLVERLLSISGEDPLPIEEKGKPVYPAKIPARLMIGTNIVPQLPDSSTALEKRFLVLRFRHSFFGRENTKLVDQLTEELGGILMWALEGWQRLNEQGRFTEPESGREIKEAVAELGSPIHQFVMEKCIVKAERTVSKSELYSEWKQWCEDNGHKVCSSAQFGTRLKSVVSGLDSVRPRTDGIQGGRLYTGIGLADRL